MKQCFLCILSSFLFLAACNSNRIPPKRAFEHYTPAPTPDYAQAYTWSSLPETEDFSDQYPKSVSPEQQAEAKADVFFIHPTTFMGGLAWNASVEDKELNAKTDERAILHQSSAFNEACKVYAPRYRQMCFGAFFGPDSLSKIQAINLAYSDVKSAFDYYLEHYNEGRPIVIASHSQGSIHGIRLLKEYFDGTELQPQLVAAYLPGWPFPADTFAQIPVCDSASQTGCVMGWCTFRFGYEPESFNTFYKDAVVVNPINWKTDTTIVDQDMHKGFLTGNYKNIRSQSLSTQVHGGILWSSNPLPIVGARVKNYHIGDFNLFWLDVRENVKLRVDQFSQKQPSQSP